MAKSPLLIYPGAPPDTGIESSRYSQLGPNVDGLWMVGPEDISQSGPNALSVTRSATGRWGFTRTAAGAETYYFRTTLSKLTRIGQPYQQGGFGGAGISFTKAPFPAKGFGVQDAFCALQIGVVALTSATLRVGKTVYSATVAPVQTDLLAATALGSLVANTSPLVQDVPVPVANQAWNTDDLGLVEVELSIVMASTGTIVLEGLGVHYSFNTN
jgi:hypothetical protein